MSVDRLSRTLWARVPAALAVALVVPGQAAAQERATDVALVGTVYDSTAAGPLAGAAVYVLNTPHVTTTDSLGRFALVDPDTGTFVLSLRHPRLDSLGFATPPQWQIDVRTGVNRVRLTVPSIASIAPNLCVHVPESTHRGAVVGMVRDASTGTVLPDATVEFMAGAYRDTVQTDAQGRYVACALPTAERILARASFLRRAPSEMWLDLDADQPVYRAFELGIAPGPPVSGRLVDGETDDAVDGAVVVVESSDGETTRVLTDADGRFDLGRLNLETYLIQVEHVAYGAQSGWFTVVDVEPVRLEIAAFPEAVALEGLTVSVSSTRAERRVGARVDAIDREEIEGMLGSARNIADLVRTIPGIRVREDMDPQTGQPRLCIEGRRTATPGCQSVLVVVDGLVSSPVHLQALPPQAIQSIEYIPSILAGTRYGLRSGYGVLEVTTRSGGG